MNKYRLAALAVVALAVIGVIYFTGPGLFPGEEREQGGIEGAVGNNGPAGVETDRDGGFKPADDPHASFVEARSAGLPVVLKFYARW